MKRNPASEYLKKWITLWLTDYSIYLLYEYDFFRPCFFSEAKKAKERFKVVVVGGGSDR